MPRGKKGTGPTAKTKRTTRRATRRGKSVAATASATATERAAKRWAKGSSRRGKSTSTTTTQQTQGTEQKPPTRSFFVTYVYSDQGQIGFGNFAARVPDIGIFPFQAIQDFINRKHGGGAILNFQEVSDLQRAEIAGELLDEQQRQALAAGAQPGGEQAPQRGPVNPLPPQQDPGQPAQPPQGPVNPLPPQQKPDQAPQGPVNPLPPQQDQGGGTEGQQSAPVRNNNAALQ